MVSVKHGRGATALPLERWDVLDPDVLGALLDSSHGARILAEYLEARRVLEIAAAGLAAERATPADLAALSDAFDRMASAAERAAHSRAAEDLYQEADIAFHRALIDATGNRAFGSIVEPIHRALTAARRPLARPELRLERGLPNTGASSPPSLEGTSTRHARRCAHTSPPSRGTSASTPRASAVAPKCDGGGADQDSGRRRPGRARARPAGRVRRCCCVSSDVASRRSASTRACSTTGISPQFLLENDDLRPDAVPDALRQHIEFAQSQVRAFALAQLATLTDLRTEPLPGVVLGHRHLPVGAVGAYVPGGRYPMFASSFMTVLVAKAAGVPRVVACTPPQQGHGPPPIMRHAIATSGADAVLCLGGVQALAAMAFGHCGVAARRHARRGGQRLRRRSEAPAVRRRRHRPSRRADRGPRHRRRQRGSGSRGRGPARPSRARPHLTGRAGDHVARAGRGGARACAGAHRRVANRRHRGCRLA